MHNSTNQQLKIAHLISYNTGGAWNGTNRLNDALNRAGIESKIFTIDSIIGDDWYSFGVKNKLKVHCEKIISSNIYPGNTLYSPSISGLDKKHLNFIDKFNIINLHWVVDMLSVETIAYLSHLDKPIVITIRDMNPLTGGCHYFHGCEKWKTDCMNCPQLINTYDNYPAKILKAKKKYFNFKNITIVALSNHSKKIIEQSIYKDCRIEIIPNSIETDIFTPLNKKETKIKLNLPLNKKIIFFVPSYNSTVKGMKELTETLNILKDKKDDYHLLIAGNGDINFNNNYFNITRLGYISSNEKLALAYSTADITIVPSLEETFSNTTAESLSCATPVVGFKVGGIPDMIEDGYNGYTVELGDIEGLADSINKILEGKDLSDNCRKYAEDNLRLDIQAKRYKELYEDLLKTPPQGIEKAKDIPEIFSETSPALISLLLELQKNLYSFIKLSLKIRLVLLVKYLAKKANLYLILKRFYKIKY